MLTLRYPARWVTSLARIPPPRHEQSGRSRWRNPMADKADKKA